MKLNLETLELAADDDAAQQRDKARKVDTLAKRFAAGEEVDLDLVNGTPKQAILDRIAHHRPRIAWRETLTAAQAANAERPAIEAAIAAADADLARAQAARDAIVRPLGYRLQEISQMQCEAAMARSSLLSTCDDAEILESCQVNQSRTVTVNDRLREQQKLAQRTAENIAALKASGGDPKVIAFKTKTLDSLNGEIAALRTELSELVSESDSLVKFKVEA